MSAHLPYSLDLSKVLLLPPCPLPPVLVLVVWLSFSSSSPQEVKGAVKRVQAKRIAKRFDVVHKGLMIKMVE